jgi:hypothetical protein
MWYKRGEREEACPKGKTTEVRVEINVLVVPCFQPVVRRPENRPNDR